MLDGIRAMANDLGDIAKASVARLQPRQPAAPESESPDAGTKNQGEPTAVATDESASTGPGSGARGSSGESARRG